MKALDSFVQRQPEIVAECFGSLNESSLAGVAIEALFTLLILSELSGECFAVMTGHCEP